LRIGKAALEKAGYELVKIEFDKEIIKEAGILYTGQVLSNVIQPILE
jgi:hypothetical protein